MTLGVPIQRKIGPGRQVVEEEYWHGRQFFDHDGTVRWLAAAYEMSTIAVARSLRRSGITRDPTAK